jgi:hypothetical protein
MPTETYGIISLLPALVTGIWHGATILVGYTPVGGQPARCSSW